MFRKREDAEIQVLFKVYGQFSSTFHDCANLVRDIQCIRSPFELF